MDYELDVPLKCVLSALALGAGLLCFSVPSIADPTQTQSQTSVADQANSGDTDNNGEDFTRPQASVSMRIQYRTSGTTSTTEREREMLQFNTKVDLGSSWKLGTLIQVPYLEETKLSPGQPTQAFTGLGALVLQNALIDSINKYWAFGFGARLESPPANASLGTYRWQIMPGAGVRYSFLEINDDTYFVPVVRYAIGFGGNPTARTIREPQIAPTLNIGLPDRWFFTFYPSNDIRINYGTPISGQTGRLFLPLDMAVGKIFTNNLVVMLEGGFPIVNEYPVYKFKTELRVTWKF